MATLKLWLHSEWKQNQKILNPKQNKTEEKPNQKTPQPTKNQNNNHSKQPPPPHPNMEKNLNIYYIQPLHKFHV